MNTNVENEASAGDRHRARVAACQERKSKRDTALDESGIGHDVQDRMRDGAEVIGAFVGEVTKGLTRQLHHDLLTNVPCGIMSRHAWDADKFVRRSIAGSLGALVQWDIVAARELAADILEDVNDHGTAKMLRELKD